MIKVGLLGAGRIAGVHAMSVTRNPDSSLVAVSDFIPENAEKLASQYGCSARNTDEIIADPNIDAVLIATSTDTHSELIEQSVAAGKAVFCEKPVDLSLERARLCYSNIKAASLPIMIGFNRRFDPNFKALKSALDAGEVGKAELLSITSFDPAPPPLAYIKVSGGLFKDMMIHDFDMVNFLFGGLPKSIMVSASSIIDKKISELGDYDTAVATLKYADGRLVVIKNSRRAAYGYDQRIEILGSKGLLQVQNVVEDDIIKSTEMGVQSSNPEYFFLERYKAAYKKEWAAFVSAVQMKTTVPITLADGISALAMAEAAAVSAKAGSEVELANFL